MRVHDYLLLLIRTITMNPINRNKRQITYIPCVFIVLDTWTWTHGHINSNSNNYIKIKKTHFLSLLTWPSWSRTTKKISNCAFSSVVQFVRCVWLRHGNGYRWCVSNWLWRSAICFRRWMACRRYICRNWFLCCYCFVLIML